MRFFYQLLGCILIGLLLLISCQSVKPIKRLSNEGFMYAMIYDYDNSPVPGVSVYLNGKKIVDSDIQGRFILEKMDEGDYNIRLEKNGYERIEGIFHYDPLQVLYFKMINSEQLVVLAENALDSTEFASAESYLNRALLLEPNRPDILFLKSITYFLQNKNSNAEKILEDLVKSGNTDPSVQQLLEKIRQIGVHEE